jgi:hypothetical protein
MPMISLRLGAGILTAFVGSTVLAQGQPPARRTAGAPAFVEAIDLVPEDASSALVVPSPKLMADDLAECLARLGDAASALPLRPIDLLKSQAGFGPGVDETRSFVLWHQRIGEGQVPAMLVPVTDATVFMEGNFERVDGGSGTGWSHPQLGKVHARGIDRHVLLSSSEDLVKAFALKPGMDAALRRRLGDRGYQVLTSGDLAAWAGPDAFAEMRRMAQVQRAAIERGGDRASRRGLRGVAEGSVSAAARREQADLDGNGAVDSGDLSLLLLEVGRTGGRGDLDGDGAVTRADVEILRGYVAESSVDLEDADEGGEASVPQPADQGAVDAAVPASDLSQGLTDGVIALDLDPMGASLHTYAVMDPASPLGKAAVGGERTGPLSLRHLPKGAFVVAASMDVQGLGGVQAMQDLLAMAPAAPGLPQWVLENRDLVQAAEFAIYPSKLGVAGGGLLNDACLWLSTRDPGKAQELMKSWMEGLQGRADGMDRTVTWEAERTTKDGVTAAAWAIVEKPVADGGGKPVDAMQRLGRMLVFGPRGPMGFAKAFPDGVLVTFSQRPDVLKRCVDTIEGGGGLESDPVIGALRGWTLAEPDAEAFVGVGSLFRVLRQAAGSVPGMSIELPDVAPSVEPLAMAMRVREGRSESAVMVPAAVIGVMVEAWSLRMQPEDPGQEDVEVDEAP